MKTTLFEAEIKSKYGRNSEIPKDTLFELYITQNKRVSQIANELGQSYSCILRKIKKYGFKINTPGGQPRPSKYEQLNNRDWLYQKYIIEKLSIPDLAGIIKAAETTIVYFLRKHNIKIRGKTESLKIAMSTPKALQKRSILTKQLWSNSDFRQKISTSMFKRWQDNNYRKKIAEAGQPRFSQIHKTFSGLLTDLGIIHKNEYVLGPWSFDVHIPNIRGKGLLIEINGDWIHSLPEKKASDKAKFTYYERYLSEKYDLKYIWEHEFYTIERIKDLILYWTGKEVHLVDFNFNNTNIEVISERDAEDFISKYHYLSKLGHRGVYIGGIVDNILTSTAIFSPPVRSESFNNINVPAIELSRFCINPKYQRKNYASWLLSRFLKKLSEIRPDLRTVIAFSDRTFNHFGTIYKATNWTHVGVVKPDYWYIDKEGWVMHKKTLWNRANNLKMSEKEYSKTYNYTKVWGRQKDKYIISIGDR